jgi:hypothetical protein
MFDPNQNNRGVVGTDHHASDRFRAELIENTPANVAYRAQLAAEANEREKIWRKQNFEARAIEDINDGPLPVAISVLDSLTVTEARRDWINYRALLDTERKKLAEAESKRDVLLGLKEAPKATESTLKGFVRRYADRLLGRGQGFEHNDVREHATLTDRLAAERLNAEAAAIALPEIERAIAVSELRIKSLLGRENEFLRPLLQELAADLGRQYLEKIAEIRAIMVPLAQLNGVMNYNSSATVEFPHFHAGLSYDDPERRIHVEPGRVNPWTDVINTLRTDARAVVTVPGLA